MGTSFRNTEYTEVRRMAAFCVKLNTDNLINLGALFSQLLKQWLVLPAVIADGASPSPAACVCFSRSTRYWQYPEPACMWQA